MTLTYNKIIRVFQVWPEDNVYFPDYWADQSREWWIQECVDFYAQVPYDGVWLVSVLTISTVILSILPLSLWHFPQTVKDELGI